MKKVFGIAVFILLLAILGACNNEEPVKEQASAPATNPAEEQAPAEESEGETSTTLAGNEVFQKSCITCHSSGDITGGQAKIDGAKIHSDFQTQEELLTFVSQKMPKTAPGSLSEEEYEAVVNYLWEQK